MARRNARGGRLHIRLRRRGGLDRRPPRERDRPGVLSQGTYGAKVAVPQILELLRRHDLRATFFIPGRVAERYPERVREIIADGHEIGHHGYTHTSPANLDAAAEEDELVRALEVLRGFGAEIAGYRSPSWDFSPRTLDLLERHGFEYSSNLMDDIRPYRHPGQAAGGAADPVDPRRRRPLLVRRPLELDAPDLGAERGARDLGGRVRRHPRARRRLRADDAPAGDRPARPAAAARGHDRARAPARRCVGRHLPRAGGAGRLTWRTRGRAAARADRRERLAAGARVSRRRHRGHIRRAGRGGRRPRRAAAGAPASGAATGSRSCSRTGPRSSRSCSRSRAWAPRWRRSTRPTPSPSTASSSTTWPRSSLSSAPARPRRRGRPPARSAVVELLPWEPGTPARLSVGDGVNTRGLAPAIQGRPDDVALLLHTSGTTSRPKQVPLLQRNLTAQARVDRAPLRAQRRRRVVLRDAALPRPRPRRLDAGPARRRRHRGRPAALQPAPVLGPGRGARSHLVLGRADAAPDDPRPGRRPGRRRCALPGRAARRSRRSCCAPPRRASGCR